MILDGNVVAEQTQAEIRAGVARLRERYGVGPTLAVLLLGTDPASALYVRSKKRMAAAVGIESPPRLRSARIDMNSRLGIASHREPSSAGYIRKIGWRRRLGKRQPRQALTGAGSLGR